MATTNATAPKGAPKKQSQGFTGIKSGFTVIILCCIIAVCIYLFVFGSASNFKGDIGAAFVCMSDAEAFEPAGLIGTVYMGGFVVPIIWTLLFSVIAFSIERYFAIRNAYGRSSLTKFVADIKAALQANDLVKAQAICDKQRGSVANVVGATLKKYKEMEGNTVLTKEQKILEEATALEMPMMQENLPIIGSIVTLGTLTGLFGTVLGMIKSFSAMSAGDGGTDSSALAVGISEALVNTASGILTGALAVISYNYYTNKIDRLTFSLDEVGFSIVQTFSATH